MEVYFAGKLHQNVVEFLFFFFNKRSSPRGVHRALFSIWMSEEFLAQSPRHVSNVANGGQRWKTPRANTQIVPLFAPNENIVANKGRIDSYGSRYRDLEEAAQRES